MPPLPNLNWSTNLPASQDTVGVEQPDLTPDSSPGAEDGHRVLVTHVHSLRDKAQYLSETVGDAGSLPAGCLKARATALETTAPSADEKAALAGTNGTPAVGNRYVTNSDPRNTDARTPTSHATSHKAGGGDPIKLDELAAPDDNTTLNVSISAHGLTPKLSNVATQFLNGQGNWAVPAGGGGAADARYEAQIVSSQPALGTKTITVPTMGANANIPGGFDLRWLSVNGIIRKIVTTVPAGRECRVTAATTIEVANVIDNDEIELSYGA